MGKVTRELYKQLGMCQFCGKDKPAPGITYCRVCKAKKIEYNIATLSHMTDSQKEERKTTRNQKRNEYRKMLKEQGMCVECGKRKAQSGKVRCGICLGKDRIRHERSYRSKGNPSRQFIQEQGICYRCCKANVMPDKKLCKKCYEQSLKSLLIAREHIKSGWRFEPFVFGKGQVLPQKGGQHENDTP